MVSQNLYSSPVFVPSHVFHHFNNATASFSPVASPSASTSSLQPLSQLDYANYIFRIEDEFEDAESTNQQKT